jgi:ribonuclease VapC
MFVDACAIIAILGGEPSAPFYVAEIDKATAPWTSSFAAWEAIIGLSRPALLNCRFRDAEKFVTEWLELRDIDLRNPGSPTDILAHAVAVAETRGISRRSLSNFDCFHYAYAKTAGDSMLTLDEKLRATDLTTLP